MSTYATSSTLLRSPSYAGQARRPAGPDHHLWNNNGTWFIHYTVYPTPVTKERVRRSLGTRDLNLARERRDSILAAAG